MIIMVRLNLLVTWKALKIPLQTIIFKLFKIQTFASLYVCNDRGNTETKEGNLRKKMS